MLSYEEPVKRRKWPWILLSFFVFFIALIGVGFLILKKMGLEGILRSSFVRNQVVNNAELIEGDLFDLLPEALGFVEPKTYLLMFLNNTELRPGGGFIGVYATVTFDRGNMTVHALDGTESLDWKTTDSPAPTPPDALTKYLLVDGWYFRDSNWSPDFSESAQLGLKLYKREKGVMADQIDAVIGVTPTVLEAVMQRAGSVTIDGLTFTPENVVAELEHEVEYNFLARGIDRGDRKDIIHPFMLALFDRLKFDVVKHSSEYRTMVEKLIREKHIVAYTSDLEIQHMLHDHQVDGAVLPYRGDYVMWVDANLGALKTDHAIKRTLSYSILPRIGEKGEKYFEAKVTMTYQNTGVFDWRTTRYRTYARTYVPVGSELISTEGSMQTDRSPLPGVTDSGVELGKQWFGTFIAIEPGDTKSLTFTYRLPLTVQQQIQNGVYTLLIQKQLGLTQSSLTLDLDFGTTIQSAAPAEASEEWGNTSYRMKMPFLEDQEFMVGLPVQ